MSDTAASLIGIGGRWITNPKQLPICSAAQNTLVLKNAYNAVQRSDAATFFTSLALQGAQTSVVTANTLVDLCDVTGSGGYLVNTVSPTHTATHTATTIIIADGVTYTIAPTAAHVAGNRIVIGPYTNGALSTAPDSTGVNTYYDSGFGSAKVGGITVITSNVSNNSVGLMLPVHAISQNMAVLRFESSLKVQMKISAISATATDKQCGVTYCLDQS